MNKGVKFRAYPNKKQQNLINQTLGCCRLIYNRDTNASINILNKGLSVA